MILYPRRASSGFTLLEVIIAISIFALIGLASYKVLNTSINMQSATETRSESLRALQKTVGFLARDIRHVIARPVREQYGDKISALRSGKGEYVLELSRSGWRNPLQKKRSDLQRVAYRLGAAPDNGFYDPEQTYLLRYHWAVLDRAQNTEPQVQVLMSGADDLVVRFMDQSGEWHAGWPVEEKKKDTLPAAIEVQLVTAEYGEIRRLFQVGDLEEKKP